MLIKKLKTPYLEIIEKRNLEYPAFVGSIIDDLERTEYVKDLRWITVDNMNALFGSTRNPYEYFNVEM